MIEKVKVDNLRSDYFYQDDLFSFACSVVVVSLLSLALFIALHYDTPINPDILLTLKALLGIQSSTLQKLSYVAFLGLSASLILIILYLKNFHYFQMRESYLNALTFTALGIIVITSDHVIINGYKTFLFCIFGIILLSYTKENFFSDLLKKLESLSVFNKEKESFVNNGVLFFLLITLFIFWIFPFFYQLHIGSLAELIWVDGHYAVTMLGGYELANSGSIAKMYYGLGMPLIIAALLKLSNGINGIDANLVIFVKISQFLFILFVGLIFYIRNRYTWSFWLLLVAVLTMFTLSNFGIAIGYPNQSGLRFLPIAFSLFLISVLIPKLDSRTFFYSAAIICSFNVWLNPETGIILAFGVLVMLFFLKLNSGKGITKIFLYLTEFGLFFTSITLLLCVFITPLFVRDISSFSDFILLFGKTGYGGLKGKISLSAAIFLIFGLFSLLSVSLKVRTCANINSNEIWRVFISTVMLLWHSYYFNRMDEWNLWFNWVLFVFLISSYFSDFKYGTSLEILIRRLRTRSIFFVLIFVLIASSLLSQSIYSIKTSAPLFNKMIELGMRCEGGDLAMGLCLKGDAKDQFRSYITDVRMLDKKNTIVLSELTTITRLDGFNKNLNFYTPYDAVVYQQIPILKNKIEILNPKFIAWHAPDSAASKARGVSFDQQIGLIVLGNKIDQSNLNIYRGLTILQR